MTAAGSIHHRLMAAAIKTIDNMIFGRTIVYLGGVCDPLEMNSRDCSRIVRNTEIITRKMKRMMAFMKYVRNVTPKDNPVDIMLRASLFLTALKKRRIVRGEKATPVTLGYDPIPQ